MKNFMYSPDATPTGGGGNEPIHHTGNLPTKDADRATLAVAVAAEWVHHPTLTLAWKTQAEFAKDADDFDKVFWQ